MTQLPERFGFDLADAFARYCERPAHFFEGVLRTAPPYGMKCGATMPMNSRVITLVCLQNFGNVVFLVEEMVEIAGHDPGTKAYFFANFLAISSTILGRRSASTLSTMLAMELGSEPSAEAAAAMVFGVSSACFAASTVSFAGGAADRI